MESNGIKTCGIHSIQYDPRYFEHCPECGPAPEQPAVCPDTDCDNPFCAQHSPSYADKSPTAQAQDGLVERLRELMGLKYQSHTLHVPAALCAAADFIAAQASELAEVKLFRDQMLVTLNLGKRLDGEDPLQTIMRLNGYEREIAELKTKNAELNSGWEISCRQLVKRAERAEAELDALRADALRYRWLRDHAMWIHCADDDSEAGNFTLGDDDDNNMGALDAAIDAAKTAGREVK